MIVVREPAPWMSALAILCVLAMVGPAAAQTPSQPKSRRAAPDLSVLQSTPGTQSDWRFGKETAGEGTTGKRRLHLEGGGVGYDVDERLTVRGGVRLGSQPEGTAAGSGGTGPGVFIGVRRSLGRP